MRVAVRGEHACVKDGARGNFVAIVAIVRFEFQLRVCKG